ILADVAAGCRKILPRDVRDQVHQAEQAEDDRGRRRALETHAQRAYHVAMSRTGDLVRAAGAVALTAATVGAAQRAPQRVRSQLVWVDRAGKKLATVTGLADFGNIELSPD